MARNAPRRCGPGAGSAVAVVKIALFEMDLGVHHGHGAPMSPQLALAAKAPEPDLLPAPAHRLGDL
jgi:hypothetical protein